jgi:hypothetical protein
MKGEWVKGMRTETVNGGMRSCVNLEFEGIKEEAQVGDNLRLEKGEP